jgi:tetratricopeptide (TPR) repeat protein
MGAADNYYNLLVEGFRAGQLSLKKEVPPGLASLADPYDPAQNGPYRLAPYWLWDMSYYKGKLYLYFGVTPAVMLFWPYAALTGHDLLQRDAVVIFCIVGFLASVGLLWALWRRYFAEVGVAVVAALALALGLATGVPVMLSRCDVYEVSISCGYALTMLALAAIWKALHHSSHQGRWLAAASLAFGLAVGARPSLLFGAVILLVPVVQAWRERGDLAAESRTASGSRPVAGRGPTVICSAAAAVVPLALIGLGLMLYNALRFDSPFEFGGRYQLSWVRVLTAELFSPRYLWFNFRVYFLEPARWGGRFPFVHEITVPPMPSGNREGVEHAFGVLTNIPLVWLALAVPLAWRGRTAEARSNLVEFLTTVATLFGISALTLGLFFYTAGRYEMEFLPALVLLAVIGVLSLDHALTGKPLWRGAARLGWCLLLAFSVAFNLLVSVELCVEWHYGLGIMLDRQGKVQEAIGHYERALRLKPDLAEAHNNLGGDLAGQGKVQEAIGHYEQALRIKPGDPEAHNNLGVALTEQGKVQEAIGHYEQALRIWPDYANVRCNLGLALMGQGRLQEANDQFEQVLRLKPDSAEAQFNWGLALAQTGKPQEAIGHFEQALRLKPDSAEAHYNLGLVLMGEGKLPEAIHHYERVLQINPNDAEAHNNLGLALVQLGRVRDAMEHWEQALRTKPDYADAHYNLGVALEQAGRVQEAIQQYEEAVRIRPDFVQARNALARAQARAREERLKDEGGRMKDE